MKRWLMSLTLIVMLLSLLIGSQDVQADPSPPPAHRDQNTHNELAQKMQEYEQLSAIQFSYHNTLFDIDFFEILSSKAPLLDQYKVEYHGETLTASSFLMEMAHYHSINPAVLISYLEVESGILSNPQKSLLESVAGYDLKESPGFVAQVSRLAESLNKYYYAELSKNAMNAGALTVFQILAHKSENQLDAKVEIFTETYQSLLEDFDLSEIDKEKQTPTISSQPYMYLPWTYGNTMYYTGGPHNWNGGSARPWSSVDFAPGGGSGCNWVSYEPINPARYGQVVYIGPSGSPNPYHIKINHQTQPADEPWVTHYYHLRDIPNNIQVGSYVTIRTTIGYPSCQPAGSSTGVHLHFGFEYAGNKVEAHGKLLTGWTIYEGGTYYNGTMYKNGITKTASTTKQVGLNDIQNW
jgi:murein DD-endopeptidase MepM/ murein hydrolase activator NlpD